MPPPSLTFTQEEIRAFVIPAHFDLAAVQQMLTEQPGLLNTCYVEWNETALGAASHVGNRSIAEYLLNQGAPLTICAAAMLGDLEAVRGFIAADPSQVNAAGAHGISLLFHAALSGNVALAQNLRQQGNSQNLDHPLHAAIMKNHLEMARWLIEQGAGLDALDYRNETPLQAAESQGLAEMAALLRQAGAAG